AVPAVQAKEPKSSVLRVVQRPGVTADRMMADIATEGICSNAATAIAFLNVQQPDLSLTDMVESLKAQGRSVSANDFTLQEQMLTAQANTLNAIFGELCRRAAINMGTHLDVTERYLRLAMKGQSQSRVTVETLAAIKNPPVVYAKQANIVHGPQQV